MTALNETDISESRQVFEACDLNGDGFIDSAEFQIFAFSYQHECPGNRRHYLRLAVDFGFMEIHALGKMLLIEPV